MESLRLDGATIRGFVQGRLVNCVVRSVPDGLVLPSGQYLLRTAEKNPIYGLLLSIEAPVSPAAAPSLIYKGTPSTLKDSPAAIATLVPARPESNANLREISGYKVVAAIKDSPAAIKDSPSSKIDSPSFKFDFVAGRGMTARVIIATRPIGQNSLVAHAGFSDLLDAVQRAGDVALIVP